MVCFSPKLECSPVVRRKSRFQIGTLLANSLQSVQKILVLAITISMLLEYSHLLKIMQSKQTLVHKNIVSGRYSLMSFWKRIAIQKSIWWVILPSLLFNCYGCWCANILQYLAIMFVYLFLLIVINLIYCPCFDYLYYSCFSVQLETAMILGYNWQYKYILNEWMNEFAYGCFPPLLWELERLVSHHSHFFQQPSESFRKWFPLGEMVTEEVTLHWKYRLNRLHYVRRSIAHTL